MLSRTILADPWRREVLSVVREVAGSDSWIGAGFVRNPVWDRLYESKGEPLSDVDVVFFDEAGGDSLEVERAHALTALRPDINWDVRNQARMHVKHGHPPYGSLSEALARWPETATAVAVKLNGSDGLDVLAPHGLNDLLGGVLRPVQPTRDGQALMLARAREKGWFQRWPDLKIELDGTRCARIGS